MLKIYGSPRSSAGRCFVLLEELGVPYEVAPMDMRARQHKSPEFLKLNPNGKVPVLVDEDFVVWESVAINHYLCEKYRPSLLGSGPRTRALVQQWSVWSMVECQPPLIDMLIQLLFVPEERRDYALIERSRKKALPFLDVLDKGIGNKTYLVGHELTVADFNVGSVANLALALGISLGDKPNVMRWVSMLKERPSFKKFAEG
ncbi:MAG: glutathione S-transferase family protein [Bdellovibrionota bacterium]